MRLAIRSGMKVVAVTAVVGCCLIRPVVGQQVAVPTAGTDSSSATPGPDDARNTRIHELSQLGLAASAGYRLGTGDVLDVSVFGVPEYSHVVRIGAAGTVQLPLLEPVAAAGITADELEHRLESMLGRSLIRNPDVSVLVTEHRSQMVFVLGAVRIPGEYQLSRSVQLIDVLALAGGLTSTAGDEATIRRVQSAPAVSADGTGPSPELQRINLEALLESDQSGLNVSIEAGDVVHVPEREVNVFYVIGDVTMPGMFRLPDTRPLLLSQAVAEAGGPTLTSKLSGSLLVRYDHELNEREEIELDLEKVFEGGNRRRHDTSRRYRVHPGQRVQDLHLRTARKPSGDDYPRAHRPNLPPLAPHNVVSVRFWERLGRDDRWVVGAAILAAAAVLFATRTAQQIGDSLLYAHAVSSGTDVVHPHHLLFGPSVWLVASVLRPLCAGCDVPVLAGQLHNIGWAVVTLVAVYAIVKTLTASMSLSLVAVGLMFVSRGFWELSTQTTVYMPALGSAIVFAAALLRTAADTGSPRVRWWVLGPLLALAVLYHQLNVLLCLPLAVYLWISRVDGPVRLWSVVVGAAGATALSMYAGAYWAIAGAERTIGGFVRYCLRYTSEVCVAGNCDTSPNSWGTLANVSLDGNAGGSRQLGLEPRGPSQSLGRHRRVRVCVRRARHWRVDRHASRGAVVLFERSRVPARMDGELRGLRPVVAPVLQPSLLLVGGSVAAAHDAVCDGRARVDEPAPHVRAPGRGGRLHGDRRGRGRQLPQERRAASSKKE